MTTAPVPAMDRVEHVLLERWTSIRKIFFRDLEIQAHTTQNSAVEMSRYPMINPSFGRYLVIAVSCSNSYL